MTNRSMPTPMGRRARFAASIGAALLIWTAVIATGTVIYAVQVDVRPSDILRPEVLGYTAAFAVAGTIAGVAAAATHASRRWTAAFAAASLLPILASVALLRWWIAGPTIRALGFGGRQRMWNEALGVVEAGIPPGVLAGLIVSGFVVLLARAERRLERWQFGLLAAAAAALLGGVALPLIVYRLSDLIVLFSGPHYRYLFERSIYGSAIGAGTGSLVGALTVGLIARLAPAARASRALESASGTTGVPGRS